MQLINPALTSKFIYVTITSFIIKSFSSFIFTCIPPHHLLLCVFWFSTGSTTNTSQIVMPQQTDNEISALPRVEAATSLPTTTSPQETTTAAPPSSTFSPASRRYLFPELKTLQQTVKMIRENKQPTFKQIQFDNSKLCRLRKYKLVLHHRHQQDNHDDDDFKNHFLNCSSVSGRTYVEEENIEIYAGAAPASAATKNNNKKRKKGLSSAAASPTSPSTTQSPLPLVKLLRS